MADKIDYFGKFLMAHLRDAAIDIATGLCEDRFDDPGNRKFQAALASMPTAGRKLLLETVAYSIDAAMNEFLAQLDREMRSKKKRLLVTVDETPCTELSAALHKELHGPKGWKARFSEFKAITAK